MYLIVPAFSDMANQCRIVFKPDASGAALKQYRQNPEQWTEVGRMNAKGVLVYLDAPKAVVQAFKQTEPLMAGLEIDENDLPADERNNSYCLRLVKSENDPIGVTFLCRAQNPLHAKQLANEFLPNAEVAACEVIDAELGDDQDPGEDDEQAPLQRPKG